MEKQRRVFTSWGLAATYLLRQPVGEVVFVHEHGKADPYCMRKTTDDPNVEKGKRYYTWFPEGDEKLERFSRSPAIKNAPIIGLAGYRGSGKSWCAATLSEYTGLRSCPDYWHLSFAGPLRQAAQAIWGWGHEDFTQDRKNLVSRWGMSPRDSLIFLGEALRNQRPDHWIQRFRDSVKKSEESGNRVICDDVRYLNECQAIIDMGGMVVWVDGPGIPAPEVEVELEGVRSRCAFELQNLGPGVTSRQEVVRCLLEARRGIRRT